MLQDFQRDIGNKRVGFYSLARGRAGPQTMILEPPAVFICVG
jgi:hypothetical protein